MPGLHKASFLTHSQKKLDTNPKQSLNELEPMRVESPERFLSKEKKKTPCYRSSAQMKEIKDQKERSIKIDYIVRCQMKDGNKSRDYIRNFLKRHGFDYEKLVRNA
jgi:hypothetical protein